MCGIIGYIGSDNTVSRLIEGLRALEYRGYDSAGVAWYDGGMRVVKASGKLDNLAAKLGDAQTTGIHAGIGHTRWATHGAPSDTNAHPHGTPALQLVHNGIIENYAALRAELTELGYTFQSDTDTEAAAKLLDYYYTVEKRSPLDAISRTAARLEGSYALGILFADDPLRLYALRSGSPLIVGLGEGENFIASDITALLRHTRDYYQLEEGEIAVVEQENVCIYRDGVPVEKERKTALWDVQAAERGGWPHFMIKEIHEEPTAIKATLHPRVKGGLPDFSGERLDTSVLAKVSRLHIVACGTAMHAGLIARGLFESLAALPVTVEVASEFRYNNPLIDENDLVIIISQSGETADSLAALRLAKEKGAPTLAIVNVIGSSIAREADSVLYTWAGPEIAVASTKAYSVQTALLALLAVETALLRGRLDEARGRALVTALCEDAPLAVEAILDREEEIKALAASIAGCEDLFFIGRGAGYYLAAEGSLKLKEISYIHSEAYAAGELKHGTISLIVDGTPVVALCTVPELYGKMVSNIREVKARGANVIAVVCADADTNGIGVDSVVRLPQLCEELLFLPAVTVLQLLAYYTSVARGCDVDQPRNLAKSVTVE
ncbi:MAG: glutamine--fructose-6-phosphate transaminase (isomerizing) [Clostridia bacterium]|nr:glutamine--fructose-6-phosphate transaminase (isomerizing) [Clostridia bacterium]